MMGTKGNTGMEGIKGGVGDKVMNHLCFADQGFLVGGGANIQNCQIFLKKCMKLRKFWSMGGACTGGTPLDPPLNGVMNIHL